MPDDLDDHPLRRPGRSRRRGSSTAAALVAIVAGAVLLVAGYWGASDTTSPGDQLPYFASATVPGLALTVLGAILLLRREHERDRDELRALSARIEAIVDWLADGAAGDDDVRSANGELRARSRPGER